MFYFFLTFEGYYEFIVFETNRNLRRMSGHLLQMWTKMQTFLKLTGLYKQQTTAGFICCFECKLRTQVDNNAFFNYPELLSYRIILKILKYENMKMGHYILSTLQPLVEKRVDVCPFLL